MLLKTYRETEKMLDKLDFDTLFHGFHRYRFALYTDNEICLGGKIIPNDCGFFGNTSILYKGEYIAIWNIQLDPVEDLEMLAALIVHEMFHCHQNTNGESRYPSDLAILAYPDTPEGYAMQHRENVCLADAYMQNNFQALRTFAAVRQLRRRTNPQIVEQTLKAETIEGTAEYIGIRALRQLSQKKFDDRIREYTNILNTCDGMLFDTRRIAYYSGTMFFLCLEKYGLEVKNDFTSNLTVYDQNTIDTDDIIIAPQKQDFISKQYKKLVSERTALINETIAKSVFVPCNAHICGYDPMNMFRVQNKLYSGNYVCVDADGITTEICSDAVLEMLDGSVNRISGYYKTA